MVHVSHPWTNVHTFQLALNPHPTDVLIGVAPSMKLHVSFHLALDYNPLTAVAPVNPHRALYPLTDVHLLHLSSVPTELAETSPLIANVVLTFFDVQIKLALLNATCHSFKENLQILFSPSEPTKTLAL